jgi:hypothetical protein
VPQFYKQLVYKATLSFTPKFENINGGLFRAKKNHKRHIIQLFSAALKYRKKKNAYEKLEKTPSKVTKKNSN